MNYMRFLRKSFSTNPPAERRMETLFERLVSLMHVPYAAGCFLLAVVLGIPGTLLTRYIDSFDFAKTISIAGVATGSEGYWRAVTFYWIITYLVFFFYLFYFLRYFRLTLLKTETRLMPLLEDGKGACNKAFRIVPSKIGALATASMVAASFAPSVYRMLTSSLGTFSAIHVLISQAMLDFAGGTGIWLFFSSIWSLRKLAKEPLKLKSSSEDPLFGLGSIGSLSLALVIIYFGALGLRGLGTLASGVETTPTVINLAFESILMTFGFIMFLVTINSFHRKMAEQKELEKCRLNEQRKIIHEASVNCSSKTRISRAQTEKLLVLDIMEGRLDKTSTWPFDKGVLSNISTILLSVTAIMIARILVVAVHL